MFEVVQTPVGFFTVVFFAFGAILGSFANVVILRMPAGKSVVMPGSHCGSCGKPVRWFHNIPIISWFLLRGRCASCGTRFSIRYPLVELLMAVLFAACFRSVGWSWVLPEYLYFIFGLVTVSFIDLDHMILPDKFTYSGIVIGLVGAALNPERVFLDSLMGVLMGGGFLWAIAYLYWVVRRVEGMGGGDIKLLAWIGAVLGWQSIPMVIIGSSIVGSIVGIAMMVKTKGGLKTVIPFGPYLAAAAIFYVLFDGSRLGEWYLRLHGLAGN